MDKTTDENFIGYINPIRYRGYYYDTETGLYYLNARYYDPEVGKFISADEFLYGNYNLFSYCYSNPINFSDYTGLIPDPVDYMVCIGAESYYPGIPPRTQLPKGNATYNCWGWVLQKITGKFELCNPIDFEHELCTVQNLTNWVINTLEQLGQTATVLGELNDNQLANVIAELSNNEYLIAMRVGTGKEYHFMRYDNGAWTHKYGPSGRLFKLIYVTPNDNRVWANHIGNPFNGQVTINNYDNPYSSSKTFYIKSTFSKKIECIIS